MSPEIWGAIGLISVALIAWLGRTILNTRRLNRLELEFYRDIEKLETEHKKEIEKLELEIGIVRVMAQNGKALRGEFERRSDNTNPLIQRFIQLESEHKNTVSRLSEAMEKIRRLENDRKRI